MVRVDSGEVVLTGNFPSYMSRDRVEADVLRIRRVTSIENKLTVLYRIPRRSGDTLLHTESHHRQSGTAQGGYSRLGGGRSRNTGGVGHFILEEDPGSEGGLWRRRCTGCRQ